MVWVSPVFVERRVQTSGRRARCRGRGVRLSGRRTEKPPPQGVSLGSVSRFMLAAIEAQARVPESGVHEGAMMGGGRIVMDVRPEVATRHAQALRLNAPCFLKMSDRKGQPAQEAGLIGFVTLFEGRNELHRNFVAGQCDMTPIWGQMRQPCTRIVRISLASEQAFRLKGRDRIARGGLGDAQKLAHTADLRWAVIH